MIFYISFGCKNGSSNRRLSYWIFPFTQRKPHMVAFTWPAQEGNGSYNNILLMSERGRWWWWQPMHFNRDMNDIMLTIFKYAFKSCWILLILFHNVHGSIMAIEKPPHFVKQKEFDFDIAATQFTCSFKSYANTKHLFFSFLVSSFVVRCVDIFINQRQIWK